MSDASPALPRIDRRQFGRVVAAGATTTTLLAPLRRALAGDRAPQSLRYILASCMYGTTNVAEILPEVRRSGADAIDIWPRRHADQREQVDVLGHDRFADMLAEHDVRLGMLTRFDLGPFALAPELPVAKRFGCQLIITGSKSPKDATGAELKAALADFGEKLKPHAEAAAEHGVAIGIENHGSALLNSTDSIRWFADCIPSPNVGVALAPYHLPQDPELLSSLITELDSRLVHFYAWEHGMGCFEKLPKEQELMQLPGRGNLDFGPLLDALAAIDYQGWTEIFMHPVPRGIPILEPTSAVTAEINRARRVLEGLRASS